MRLYHVQGGRSVLEHEVDIGQLRESENGSHDGRLILCWVRCNGI
jgi:hypothetical protein